MALDMRVVCPQDVKKMFVKRPRMVCWKRWAAKHECEGLKDGVWLEPTQPVLRRKTNEVWTDKHRHATRKLVVEGGWVQTRLYDTGWSDEKKCRGCNREKKHREAQAVPLSVREGSWEPDPKMIGEMVSNGPTRRSRVGSGKVESRRTPLSESNWRKSHVWVQR